MGKTLTEIAQELKDSPKKVQLIYAFNGTGKTRLSRVFKDLIAPTEANAAENEQEQNESLEKILYYNAFTEDLFYWDNDLAAGSDLEAIRKLKIHPNSFTDWVLQDQGQGMNIITHFQRYTSDKLTPLFNQEYTYLNNEKKEVAVKANSEITFSIAGGNNDVIENIKISKGEESCLIWCIFFSLIEQVIDVLNVVEPNERETDKFNHLEYIFIDDPVSSLDDNHLIELAVNLAKLIKSSTSDVKFIITTHNPLFYNVLFNEFNGEKRILKNRLNKLEDGKYILEEIRDSPFSYHLFLLSELEKAIESDNIQKYHFNFLRNVLEKTSTFLGYVNWKDLLPEDARDSYYNRIINLYSHSKHNGDESHFVKEEDKRVLSFLVRDIKNVYRFR
ncbi:MAG: AAA family ATPase [Bacteroidales bacterium]